MEVEDWPRMSEIYADGIATGHATFETSVPEWKVWDAGHMIAPRLVARTRDRVVGWTAQMNGLWRDVLLFERRSTLVGFAESGVKMGCQNVKLFLGGPLLVETESDTQDIAS